MQHAYVQIVELGKRLVHYRMMRSLSDTWVKTKMSEIDTMWGYLESRHAELVREGSPA